MIARMLPSDPPQFCDVLLGDRLCRNSASYIVTGSTDDETYHVCSSHKEA